MKKHEIKKQATYQIINDDRSADMYDDLLEGIQQSFNEAVKSNEPLFVVNVVQLYDVFLNGLPSDARQHYNCRTCRNFVNDYGRIVQINDKGDIEPVMWKYSPSFFAAAVENVRRSIKKSRVTGVFITSEKTLGSPVSGGWEHMAVDVPENMIFKDRFCSSHQRAADKLEEFKMVQNAISNYRIETIEIAVNMLRSDSLYRSEKFLSNAEWFLDVMESCKTNPKRHNVLWKKIATAPDGFCHISGSMLGTLFDDITDGLSLENIIGRFNDKMNPTQYQRPQATPSVGNVERAEQIVAELGIATSLNRRFARLDEIETIWTPNNTESAITTSGVFADIRTKESTATKKINLYVTQTTMTWEKFRRTVLPLAKKIELDIPTGLNTYSALVTAEDNDAPPIIKWDTEDHRNPFSWYMYSNGSFPTDWNLPKSGSVEVTGIALMPNMWQPGYEYIGEGVFLILEGCKDTKNHSSVLFPELLRGELREVRSTIEAYSKEHKLSGYDEASACGLCLRYNSTQWKCNLRVTTDTGVSMYKLDRWD